MILLGLCVPNTISLTEEEKMGYCNSLALIKEDGESSQKLKKLSELYFLKLECTEDDACNFCDITPQPQKPGTPPPPKQGIPTDSCVKPQSFTCPVAALEQTPTQQAGGQGPEKGPGGRRKRQSPGGPMGGSSSGENPHMSQAQLLAKADSDFEANFIKQLMDVPPIYR